MISKKNRIKTNIHKLQQFEAIFQLELFNRFEALSEEETTFENMTNIMKEECTKINEAEELQQDYIDPNKDESKDKIIQELDMRRKKLRKKTDKTSDEKIEYCELNKTVKKLRRQRARQRRREQIIQLLERGKGPKDLQKNGKK